MRRNAWAPRSHSSWLTALPLEKHGHHLHKSEFKDARALRYDLPLQRLVSHCKCGQLFNVDHALSCPTGGYPSIRHNEVRDITASLLQQVCHDVTVEPQLQPLTGEAMALRSANREDAARLDISACGVWGGRFERTSFDVRVFNPSAQSNRQAPIMSVYWKHENEKKRSYEQSTRCRACLFYTLGDVSHRRNGSYCYQLLQSFSLNDKREERVALSSNHWLDPLQTELRTVANVHHVYPWLKEHLQIHLHQQHCDTDC